MAKHFSCLCRSMQLSVKLLFTAVVALLGAQHADACAACENQMFDCSDMCDCAWGGSDIVQCMMCNSRCTAKKCAAFCASKGM